MRGSSSVASAANAAIEHVRDEQAGTPWTSAAVVSRGEYGVPEGLVCSFPVSSRRRRLSGDRGPSDRRSAHVRASTPRSRSSSPSATPCARSGCCSRDGSARHRGRRGDRGRPGHRARPARGHRRTARPGRDRDRREPAPVLPRVRGRSRDHPRRRPAALAVLVGGVAARRSSSGGTSARSRASRSCSCS